jgi:hypothetical protein
MAPAGEQVRLLSRECAHSSMAARESVVGQLRLVLDRFLKIVKLPGRKDDEEGFEQYYGFA